MFAAAGLYAMDHHWPLMSVDHENARYLASSLQSLGVRITKRVDTNMVFFDTSPISPSLTMSYLESKLLTEGIKIFGGDSTQGRLVLHHHITKQDIDRFTNVLERILKNK